MKHAYTQFDPGWRGLRVKSSVLRTDAANDSTGLGESGYREASLVSKKGPDMTFCSLSGRQDSCLR